MSTDKKTKRTIIFGGSIFLVGLLFLGLFLPRRPTKAQLCKDLHSRIETSECKDLNTRFDILHEAFPLETTTSDEIKSALGEYFVDEHLTEYGHYEVYYLSVAPIDRFLGYYDSYTFTYDTNGFFISFSYDD